MVQNPKNIIDYHHNFKEIYENKYIKTAQGVSKSLALYIHFPVEPKPFSALTVSFNSSTWQKPGVNTGVTTSCAIRSPWQTVRVSVPWLCSATINSPVLTFEFIVALPDGTAVFARGMPYL